VNFNLHDKKAGGNIWSLFIKSGDDDELLCAELWEFGTLGLEETGEGLLAYFEDSVGLADIRPVLAGREFTVQRDLPPVTVEEADDRDPILIGKRFVLTPAHRIVLPIDAAMAFGSGRHETTQLCLEALENVVQPGQTVYDVGCGSGILALAALKLDAGLVIASDIDEAALAVARRHFPGPLFAGSADCFSSQSADVVLSNITGAVNDHIAFDLKRIVKADGVVIVSGFTGETAPLRFKAKQTLKMGEWECWICDPDDVTVYEPAGDANRHKTQWWL